MRWIMSLALLGLTALSVQAEEKNHHVLTLIKMDDGAMLDVKEPVHGHPASLSYRLTQLRCAEGSKSIRVLLPVDKTASLAMDDTTLKRAKGRWTMMFKAHGVDYSEKVEFKSLSDKHSKIALAAEITIDYEDALWKALVDKSGNKLWAMNGGLGTAVSVPEEAEVAKFLAACHIGNK